MLTGFSSSGSKKLIAACFELFGGILKIPKLLGGIRGEIEEVKTKQL